MLISRRLGSRRLPTTVLRSLSTAEVVEVVENEGSGKLWGGRFEKDTDPDAVNWAESLTCDEEMVTEDLWGSMAHVTMLGRQGVIEPAKAGKLMNALLSLQNQNMAGELDFFEKEFKNHDDVHMNMEARLIKMTGMDIGGRMHTTRSRNDQVPVSSQLRTRNLLLQLRSNVVDAANAFLDRAEEPGALEQVMPGYTHFQHAQPISVAFWISHYAAALSRDLSRLSHAYNSVDANPLGGGAISGTSFPIDRHLTTRLLGFQKVRRHALDATGHRDWMCEVLNSNATLSTTFSRLAEELIMWSSYEFRTVTLDDGFAMGSSMMPQKKNPGTIELLRGRHGILSGYAAAGLSMLHGLPSGYNRDFHEEKELLFASTNMAIRASQIVAPVVSSTQFNLERMEELCDKNFMTATELANWLVKEHGVPFRETHHVVGSLVGAMVKQGKDLTYLDDVVKHLNDTCGLNTSKEEIKPVLTPKDVMLSYNSFGGTGPEATKETVQELREEIQNHADVLSTDMNRVSSAMEATRAICRDVSTDGSCTTGQLQSLIEKYSPA